MPGKFEGRAAIITAGGSGIGAATARRFVAEGASVVIADLSGKRGEAVANELREAGGRVEWIKMDVADPDAVEATVKLCLDTFGSIDIMFNNAGLAEPGRIEDLTLESWNRVLAVTVTSTFLFLKQVLPIMRSQGRGVVVNTASVSGLQGDPEMSSYNVGKAGVVNLTRAAALENAKYGIRVNCVCPGTINTRVAQVLAKGREEEFNRIVGGGHPIGRLGEADEVANAVTFLASDEASFITGAALVVDGGITAFTGIPTMPPMPQVA
jgi:meso-butanediol dehydrogenase/(S,S)-butanediol dehydrogenase/diacetyl reductase